MSVGKGIGLGFGICIGIVLFIIFGIITWEKKGEKGVRKNFTWPGKSS